jgi:hypothetical protein
VDTDEELVDARALELIDVGRDQVRHHRQVPAALFDARDHRVDVGMDERVAHAGEDHRLHGAKRVEIGEQLVELGELPPALLPLRRALLDEQRRVIPARDTRGIARVRHVDVHRARTGRRSARRDACEDVALLAHSCCRTSPSERWPLPSR